MEDLTHDEDSNTVLSVNAVHNYGSGVVDWGELGKDVREYFPPNKLSEVIAKHSETKGEEIVGFDFNGIDQLTDDIIILLTETFGSKTSATVENVIFFSFVGCVHLTDYGVKLLTETFRKLREIHLDGCPLLTEASLIYLKKCPDISIISMAGTSVTIKPDMNGIAVKLDGCPIIPTGHQSGSNDKSPVLDPIKLVIIAKSNWTYDVLDFLTRDTNENEKPLKNVPINRINYTTGIKLGTEMTETFNVFETYAASSLYGQFMSEKAVHIVTLDMETPAALNPQVIFLTKMNNIFAVSPFSHVILLAIHSEKNSEETSARLIIIGDEMMAYLKLQKKSVTDNIEEWKHTSSILGERHFKVQQKYSKMRYLSEITNSFSLLQINSETSKVIQRWPTGSESSEDLSVKIKELEDSIEQTFDSGLTEKHRRSQMLLRSLSKADISEVKSFSSIPPLMASVASCVLIVLGYKDTSWKSFKRCIGDYRFLNTLQTYDYDSITERMLKHLKPFINDENEMNKVKKASHFLACLWDIVLFIYEYGTEVKPKKDLITKLKKQETQRSAVNPESQGPEQIIAQIQAAVNMQKMRTETNVMPPDDITLSEVENCVNTLKESNIVTLEILVAKIKNKDIADVRVLAAILKHLDNVGKCLYFPCKRSGDSYVITNIQWYMKALNTLYAQKYTNETLKNGARFMALDPDVVIFTDEVIKDILPECEDKLMRKFFIDSLLMQGLLCPVPLRSALSDLSKESHWFIFGHMKSSYLRDTDDHYIQSGKRFKDLLWPHKEHLMFSLTDSEIVIRYRLTQSMSTELLPRFLSECIQLGEIVTAAKSGWISRCGAIEVMFKHNIKQVDVSSSLDINARLTQFEEEPLPCAASLIHQYMWSVLSHYLIVLDALIADYPYISSRIKKQTIQGGNVTVDDCIVDLQSLLPFHDFLPVTRFSNLVRNIGPYFNLPVDNIDADMVKWLCVHCGISSEAMIKLSSSVCHVSPGFSTAAFEEKKGGQNVCGSLLSSRFTTESADNKVLVILRGPLELTGVKDINITVIKEGTIKLVISKKQSLIQLFSDQNGSENAWMTYDLGNGILVMNQDHSDTKTTELKIYACHVGDSFTLHVVGPALAEIDGAKILSLKVELLRNKYKFHTCYVPHTSSVAVVLEPTQNQAPSVVLQAPAYPMIASHHYAANMALLYRIKSSSQWKVGHVVSHSKGYINVTSGHSETVDAVLPCSTDILPLTAFMSGITVICNKDLLKSSSQLRTYIQKHDVQPLPQSLFVNATSGTRLHIWKHEPKTCTMNVNSPFVLNMGYDVQETKREMHKSQMHIFLPHNISNLGLLNPSRQLVHRWKDQDIHLICSGSSQISDMHFMDASPLEVITEDLSILLSNFLPAVTRCYHCLLGKQQDILPFVEQIFPNVKNVSKDKIVGGVRIFLNLYKSTFILAQHILDRKLLLRSVKNRVRGDDALTCLNKYYSQLNGIFTEGSILTLKCENHVVFTFSVRELLDGKVSSLKYASCVNTITIVFPAQSQEVGVIWDELKRLPNLQSLTMVNPPSLEGVSQCRRLTSLSTRRGSYTSLPDDLINLKDTLTCLDIMGSPLTELPDFITEFHSLSQLTIKNTLVRELPQNIGNLRNLVKLDATSSLISSLPESFGSLKNLNHLNLSGVHWEVLKSQINTSEQVTLEYLQAKILPLMETTTAFSSLLKPEKLEEFFNKADVKEQKLLSCEQWNSFNMLIFDHFPRLGSHCKDKDTSGGLPLALFKCHGLCYLSLNDQAMHSMPDEVRNLSLLKIVHLARCPNLENVSLELGRAPLKFLDVTNCSKLKTPPKEIVEKGKKTVMAYIKRLSQGSVKINRTKLMFVGLGGAGKTSLLRALMSADYKAPLTEGEAITDGIDITIWSPTETLTYSVWDFAGQTVYYNTHQFFMSNRAVYILVWNTRLGYQHSGLEFWLSSIACHCPSSPVFIVGTHADKIENPELPQKNLTKRFSNIKGFFVVSSYTGQGIQEMSNELQSTTRNLPYMGGYIPEAWLNFEKAILEKRTSESFLDWKTLECLGTNCGILGTEVKQVVHFLSDLGTLQYFNHQFLRDRIVINPQWIVDVMACIVSVHGAEIQDGRLKHSDIGVIWKDYPKDLHDWLLRLTEVFDLTFPVEAKQMNIIPCLLPSSEPEYDWPVVDNDGPITETKLIYKFDYLPAGLFNRVQVRLYQFSEETSIWRTGSILIKNGHHCIIKQTGDQTVLVRACGLCPENIILLVHEVFEELIAQFFTGIKYEYQIPCSGCVKMGTSFPAMFSSTILRRAIDMKTSFLQCHSFFHTLSLTELQGIIPPHSGGDFEIQMHKAVRELSDLENTVREDVFFLLCKEDIPDDDDKDTVDPQQIKEDLERHNISCWYEKDLSMKKPDDIDVAMRTAKLVLVFMSDTFVEDQFCQSLLLHVINRMKKPYILLMVGQGRKWMTSSVGGHVTGQVFINFQRLNQYKDKIESLIKNTEEKLGRNSKTNLAPPDVFLSYCWSNSAAAIACGHAKGKQGSVGYGDPREIKIFLEKHGLPCWIDHERVGGVSLFHDIAEGMKQTKAVIAFVSDEYVMSTNCQMEFRFAHIALKKPIILVVIGTGYKWDATEIGMLALGYPKISFQINNNLIHDDLLTTIRDVVSKEKMKQATSQRTSENLHEKSSLSEAAFNELYEMAQRKFLRQLSGFTEHKEPFPHLFVTDFTCDSLLETDPEKDLNTEAVCPGDISETKPVFVVDELRSGQFCMKLLCEHESQWHVTEVTYPVELVGKELVEVWTFVAPYMARMLSLLKHSNISLHILGTPEGKKLIDMMEEKAGLEYHSIIKPVYCLLRKYLQRKDSLNEKGGLKCCHLPSGKYLWLCSEHQRLPSVTVIEDDLQTEDDVTDLQNPELMLLNSLRALASKWKEKDSGLEIEETFHEGNGVSTPSPDNTKTNEVILTAKSTDNVTRKVTGDVNANSGQSSAKGRNTNTDSQPSSHSYVTKQEKTKLQRKKSSQRMAMLGHNEHIESSQACLIL